MGSFSRVFKYIFPVFAVLIIAGCGGHHQMRVDVDLKGPKPDAVLKGSLNEKGYKEAGAIVEGIVQKYELQCLSCAEKSGYLSYVKDSVRLVFYTDWEKGLFSVKLAEFGTSKPSSLYESINKDLMDSVKGKFPEGSIALNPSVECKGERAVKTMKVKFPVRKDQATMEPEMAAFTETVENIFRKYGISRFSNLSGTRDSKTRVYRVGRRNIDFGRIAEVEIIPDEKDSTVDIRIADLTCKEPDLIKKLSSELTAAFKARYGEKAVEA